MVRKVIAALDTADLDHAIGLVKRLSPHIGAFKIGHALTLNHGLDVIDRLQDAGASRVFLDLKFHDIPNVIGLAVREAVRRNVWMMTMHISGGPAMMSAAAMEARSRGENAPILLGVSVLTSLDQHILTDHLGIQRTLEDHMVYLSQLACDCGLDGVVCSPHEVQAIRGALGRSPVIVTPGIRAANSDVHDQVRVGDAQSTLSAGADYLVVGRALTDRADDPQAALRSLGFEPSA